MGERKRRAAKIYGGKTHLVDAEMRIARFRAPPDAPATSKRVEFYIGDFTWDEAYAALCAVKQSFDEANTRKAAATTPERLQ